MINLIALVGFQGSGKDTAGQFLVEQHGFINFSFAESLKDALASIFCWDRVLLEGHTKESRLWRETVDVWWANALGIPHFTPRWAMQNFGTDIMRKHFHEDIWILNIERKLLQLPENSNVVFIDGRFPNELNLGRKYNANVVRVRRGGEPLWYDVALAANGFPNSEGMSQADAIWAMENHYKVHASEWAWIGQPIDKTIDNDGSIEDLYSLVLMEIPNVGKVVSV